MPTRVLSDSDSDSPSTTSKPPAKKSKTRRSADDVNPADVLPTRTRTKANRHPSEKQAENEKENQAANVASLRRQLKQAEKEMRKAGQTRAPAAANDGPESEEVSEDEGNLQSSIKPLGPLPLRSPQRPAATIRRKAAPGTALPPKVTNRTFLTRPEQPRSEGLPSPTSSPSPFPGGSMDSDNDSDNDLFEASQKGNTPPPPPRRQRQSTAPATSPGPSVVAPTGSSSPSPPSSDPVKPQRAVPKFADNYTSGGKPKAGDYEPTVAAIINRAAHEYELNILVKNYNPDVVQQTTWAKDTFKAAGRSAGQRFKLTERIAKILTARGSHARGMIITPARALFPTHYGFKTGTKSSSAIRFNQKLSAKLIDKSAFHYKDPDAPVLGFAENTIFSAIRKQSVFKNKRSIGIVYQSQFNPWPNELLALEFCALEHCANEWKTGVHVQTDFDESSITELYSKHLASIQQWNSLKPDVVKNIRTKFFKRASNGLIISSVTVDKTSQIDADQEMSLRADLAGRSGLTDSEEEPEEDEPEDVNADANNGAEDGH
ncbi:hypothetical protein R3P38DRAFT_3116870 [Favolaschia claudopus]|uniref:DUF6532 domain-containing protein n=1 Tax=Favolaschia claudopus TaxID=2862362 RepID=A0AAV9ZF98_9AGAR